MALYGWDSRYVAQTSKALAQLGHNLWIMRTVAIAI